MNPVYLEITLTPAFQVDRFRVGVGRIVFYSAEIPIIPSDTDNSDIAVLILYHQYNIFTIPGQYYEESTKARNLPLAQAIRDVLVGLLMIVGIFSIGSLAMIRWSRRFRKRLLRKAQPPTPAEDVWAMHRLPNEENKEDTLKTQKP